MRRTLKPIVIGLLVVCAAAAGSGADRLPVLEFFGRPGGGYCAAAGPSLKTLQAQLAGQAVVLEYDFDRFRDGRLFRFWTTGADAPYLPLVMVGSGYRTSSGSVDYYNVYSNMLAAEMRRPPRVTVDASWRRDGSAMRAYVTIHNTSSSTLRVADQAAAWIIVYSKENIGVSNTWVRSTLRWAFDNDLVPGATVSQVIEDVFVQGASWNTLAGIVLIEDRTGGGGSYDMAQAAVLDSPTFSATPENLTLTLGKPTADITFEGPHVLQWTATADVPWIELAPSAGTLPEQLTVTLIPELRPPGERFATVRVDAVGDSMVFDAQVEVAVGGRVRRPILRVSPNGSVSPG